MYAYLHIRLRRHTSRPAFPALGPDREATVNRTRSPRRLRRAFHSERRAAVIENTRSPSAADQTQLAFPYHRLLFRMVNDTNLPPPVGRSLIFPTTTGRLGVCCEPVRATTTTTLDRTTTTTMTTTTAVTTSAVITTTTSAIADTFWLGSHLV